MSNNKTWVDYFFKKSKAQKGFIYCCKKTVLWVNSINGDKHVEVQWKYGKTKNIKRRMKMYGENYELLAYYPVNHLSLRENFIRHDWNISEEQRWKDARDEHVDFDISEIVEDYATAEIKLLKPDSWSGIQTVEIHTKEGLDSCTEGILMEVLHF
jgi:hypothetical protein